MKTLLFCSLFFFTANNSIAQTSVSDTLNVLSPRGDVVYYYIDGIRVRGGRDIPEKSVEEVSVIVGGLPVDYGDLNSSIIHINTAPAPAIPRKVIVLDKEQKLATE
jgi:hypothetical protein